MEKAEKGRWSILKDYKHIWLLCIFCAMIAFAKSDAGERFVGTFSGKEENVPVIVIDPGHGGADPGKVGITGVLEKEINLAIALKLQSRLEKDGVKAVLTRESDEGLYREDATNKKREDMEARVRLIEETEPDFVVSIHQNSFTSENCKGAQVFYYTDSEESKRLAEVLQKKFQDVLQDGNTRQAKANGEYYLLRKTACPIVIAECGFLSNGEEEALLATEEYQEKVVDALYQGIMEYCSMSTTR